MTSNYSVMKKLLKKSGNKSLYSWWKNGRDYKKEIDNYLRHIKKHQKRLMSLKGQVTTRYYDGEEMEFVNILPMSSGFVSFVMTKYSYSKHRKFKDWKVFGTMDSSMKDHELLENIFVEFCQMYPLTN